MEEPDQLQFAKIRTLERNLQDAKLVDIRDNIRGVMETISGLPFEIGTFASANENTDRELRRKGIEKIELPSSIDRFPDYDRNRQTLVLLGAFVAADYKYAGIPNLKKAERIINKAFAEA